jgi:hypothetical protein
MAHRSFDLVALTFLTLWLVRKLRSVLQSDMASVLWECLLVEGRRLRVRLMPSEQPVAAAATEATPASLGFDWQLNASANHAAKAAP